MQDQTRATAQTHAPATAPASSTSSAGASNAETQAALGLSGAPPEPAGSLEEALTGMGSLGAVVLDAMPLERAFDLALPLLATTPWIHGWIVSNLEEALAEAKLREKVLDWFFPVGRGYGATLGGELALAVNVGAGGESLLEREAEGFTLSVSGELSLGAGPSAGATIKGAFGEDILFATASAGRTVTGKVELSWDLTTDRVIGLVSPTSLLASHAAGAEALVRSAEALAKMCEPDEWSVGGTSSGKGAAFLGGAPTLLFPDRLGAAEVGGQFGGSLGRDDDRAYFEARIGAGGKIVADYDLALFGLFTLAEIAVDLPAGAEGRVRVSADWEALDRGEVKDPRFAATFSTTLASRQDETSMETDDPEAVLSFFSGGLLDDEAPAVLNPVELPDVDLRRHVNQKVEDPAVLERMMPTLMRWATEFVDDHGLVAGVSDVALDAELLVPVAAARVALDGQPVPRGDRTPESVTLEIERAIAGHLLGQPYEPGLGVDLDVEKAEGLAKREREEVFAKARLGAGLGGGLGIGPELEGAGNGSVIVTMREPAAEVLTDAQRVALLAG